MAQVPQEALNPDFIAIIELSFEDVNNHRCTLQDLRAQSVWLAEYVATVFFARRENTDWKTLTLPERRNALELEIDRERNGDYDVGEATSAEEQD